MTTNLFIPFYSVESFNKMVNKSQKHISIEAKVGLPYNRVFNHPTIDAEGRCGGCIKMSHKVCDVEIIVPDFNNWELLATYKDGVLFVADFSKELVFLNEKHGADYNRCDCCGHKMSKTMFVIRNKETKEELQVGSECAKAYGIEGLSWVEKFYAELYKIWDFSTSDGSIEYDEYPIWRGGNDSSAFQSVKVGDVIKASKLYYDECGGVWKGGYRDNYGNYYSSVSKGELTEYVLDKKGSCTDGYVEEVKKYIIDEFKDSYNEFEANMYDSIKDFYMSLADVHYMFFAIKKYESYLLSKSDKGFKKGEQIHIVGKIVNDKTEEGYFGIYHVITIKLSDGRLVIRKGSVPNKDGEVNAYAIVNNIWNGNTYLDRVTKNPKKGFEVVEI